VIVIGHKLYSRESLYRVLKVSDIGKTPPNSTLYSSFEVSLLQHYRDNSLSFAVEISTITEAILSENYGATYIVVDGAIAEELQKIADNYLFDSKIVVKVESDEELEKFAKLGIDGVIYGEGVCTV
jgi:nicotinate-nucleotide pyrophosphorylase